VRGKPERANVLPVLTRPQISQRTLLLLEELAALLDGNKDCWTAGAFARLSNGTPVGTSSPEATQRDVAGLLAHVRDHVLPPLMLPPGTIDEAYYQAMSLLERAARSLKYASLLAANDEGGYETACRVVRQAKENATLVCEMEPPAAAPSLFELAMEGAR
jgi:hypothetical protein